MSERSSVLQRVPYAKVHDGASLMGGVATIVKHVHVRTLVRGKGIRMHSTHHTEVERVAVRPLLLVLIKQTAEADVSHQDEDGNDFSTDLWTPDG